MRDVWSFTGDGYVSFYANNPYDPVVGVSTSACSGFPQLMSIWKYCICYGFKITVIWHAGSASAPSATLYIHFQDHNHAIPDGQQTRDFILENPQWIRTQTAWNSAWNITGPKRATVFKKIKDIEHKKELEPQIYQCTYSGGLTGSGLCYCTVGVMSTGSSALSTLGTVCMDCSLTYYCRIWDRIKMDA